jgi:hypothetical protein
MQYNRFVQASVKPHLRAAVPDLVRQMLQFGYANGTSMLDTMALLTATAYNTRYEDTAHVFVLTSERRQVAEECVHECHSILAARARAAWAGAEPIATATATAATEESEESKQGDSGSLQKGIDVADSKPYVSQVRPAAPCCITSAFIVYFTAPPPATPRISMCAVVLVATCC